MLVDFAPRVPPRRAGEAADTPVYTIETTAGGGNRQFALMRDGELVAWNYDPDRVIDHLVRQVSRAALSNPPPRYLLVHAAVAAMPASEGVLLTGESGSGKTTIVAALVQEGYSYLSDEAAVIDPDTLLVRPWPRPLDFKPGAAAIERFRDLLGRHAGLTYHVPADRIRKGAVGGPCALRLIIDYRHEPGAATAVESLSRAQAVAVLGAATPALRLHGEQGLRVLRDVVSGAVAYRLRGGELSETVSRVRELAERPR